MSFFGEVPKDIDTLYFLLFVYLIAIAFFQMSFADGVSTIEYLDFQSVAVPNKISYQEFVNINVSRDYSLESANSRTLGSLMKYKQDLIKQNYKIPYVVLFLYFVCIPLTIFIDFYFWFRKRKDLNTPVILLNGGVKNEIVK